MAPHNKTLRILQLYMQNAYYVFKKSHAKSRTSIGLFHYISNV